MTETGPKILLLFPGDKIIQVEGTSGAKYSTLITRDPDVSNPDYRPDKILNEEVVLVPLYDRSSTKGEERG